MAFGPEGRGKDVVSTELAVTLARLLARGGNRVGALLYDEQVERMVPPRSGRTHVLRLGHELTSDRPAATAPGATTDLAGLLHAALATIRRRSLVFVVSDFITVDGLGAPARHGSPTATRSSRCGWSIRSSWSCPSSA